MQAVLLPVGADIYALPVDWVRQVVAAPRVTRLVTASPVALGLFNLRGEIVPLLDVAALLSLGETTKVTHAVVLNSPRGPFGFAATSLPERVALDAPTAASELVGTAGAFQVDTRVVVLLDPAALLASERLGGADSRPAAAIAEVG